MKELLFKENFEKYESTEYHNFNLYDDLSYDGRINLLEYQLNIAKDKKAKPVFVISKFHQDKETYMENYGNPFYSLIKTYLMIVVEKNENKVSLKFFEGLRRRDVGKQWFTTKKMIDFITVNVKTGNIYHGHIYDYQLKKGAKKSIRKNTFINEPLNDLMSKIKHRLGLYGDHSYDTLMNAVSKFMNEVDGKDSSKQDTLSFSQRLFQYYLERKRIKYPNNFYVYHSQLFGPLRKVLNKHNNKLIESFMVYNKLSGKKIKKALHNCNKLNISLLSESKRLFGDDWINQDEGVISKLLDSKLPFQPYPEEFKNMVSQQELKKVYDLFKEVYINNQLDAYTFFDHIRLYTELKIYGENDLRWHSTDNKGTSFREEHLDWSDKIQYYKQGIYKRIYPDHFYKTIQKEIDGYFPILLDNSFSYNGESSVQSNCVKTYISRPNSLIISLRKGSGDSEERATIDYKLTLDRKHNLVNAERIQSLGKFNKSLDPSWNVALFKLDLIVLSCVMTKFEPFKIVKETKSGFIFNSESDWDENGNLVWNNDLRANMVLNELGMFNDYL